jgi:hypothetical protein
LYLDAKDAAQQGLTPAYGTNFGTLVISFVPSAYTLAPMKINFDTCDEQEN